MASPETSSTLKLPSFEQALFLRLQESDLFKGYCDAFRMATGLPLRFMRADEEWCLNEHRQNQSPFCEMLHHCSVACHDCKTINHRLMKEAEVKGPASCGCFAGLCATAVPIRVGATTIGYLKTGQVFHRQPTEQQFQILSEKLSSNGVKSKELKDLKTAYFETQTVDPKRYDSMISLLDSFSKQLSQHAEELAMVEEGKEPAAILKARTFIHQHLDEPLPLGIVARQAGLSESHFCRVFKEITGLTLTDYVTRARIAWARKELLRPATRVSEIAFQVGFQSLSQFNRSFAKINGCSPSAWREQQLEKLSA
ncbi:helix-turn-helix domain-containing protein [Roseibacillus persicicus]|uniref:helix-turn-helix domain-containing protein n=1 Tax=Roseibacillus persicicus TaxID=454148 RepID=UPI00398B97B2